MCAEQQAELNNCARGVVSALLPRVGSGQGYDLDSPPNPSAYPAAEAARSMELYCPAADVDARMSELCFTFLTF